VAFNLCQQEIAVARQFLLVEVPAAQVARLDVVVVVAAERRATTGSSQTAISWTTPR
jgi:hypothetical protein